MNYFKNHLKNVNIPLLLLPLCFAVISIVMIASTAYNNGFFFSRDVIVQFIAYIIGFVMIWILVTFDYQVFQDLEKLLYIGSILFLLTVYLPVIGLEQYSARSWINLGVTTVQPSEFVKITFILIMASYLTKHKDELFTFIGVAKAGLYALPFIVIVLKEDLGSAVVFCAIWIAMIFYAGIDYKLFAKISGVALVSIPILYRFMASHQKERIDAFLHPDNLALAGNYQVWQSKVAIGSGGFFGKGLFQGTQKELEYLPVQKSDFIFSVIVEELGFIGGAVIIALYTWFLYLIAKIAFHAKDFYGALIVVGFMGMFIFQIFENIAMSMGIMPVTGITLPFISYGGSSIVANMIAVGFILNVGIKSKGLTF